MTTNPLLTPTALPAFKQIRPEHIAPALDQVLAENRARLAALLNETTAHRWETLIAPLEVLDDRLQKIWSPVSHLHAVLTSDELRAVYKDSLPKLTAYHTEIEQNEALYQAFNTLATNSHFQTLTSPQQKIITDQLRDFHLAGVSLPATTKRRYAEIQTRLAEISNQFEEHILDATQGWTKHITNREELTGIPEHVLTAAQETAQQKGLSGWLLTLEFPCYYPVMSYGTNRALRAEMYAAYTTRASDQGPLAGRFDNSPLLNEILNLKQELSQLLGFANYAELSLATKMVKQPGEVIQFLQELVVKVRPKAEQELKELTAFAHTQDNLDQLEPWDIAYYSEKLCQQQHGINDELLRPYFPVESVLKGMFTVINKLYGISVSEEKNIETWHPDVRFFTLRDQNNTIRGQFYLDLYARPQKRGGAWMDDCQQRWRQQNGRIQTPIAFLTCNLTPPNAEQIALLTHDEVVTLFHEFGHGLHHMLTQVDYFSIAGIHGVEWDAVELPSQFMEFFVWEKEVLNFVSSHYQTGEPLPDDLLQQLRNAKNFQIGLKLIRQLEFALFDFQVHLNYQSNGNNNQIQQILDQVRAQVSVIKLPSWNRFQHSFSHIFAGGYAAGYYSYLWAEMLACDVFAKFMEQGILNPVTGQEFLTTILEQGGSAPALDLFMRFRGRQPTPAALLHHFGLTNT